MLRCSDVRETRHTYSQSTESEKAKFQTPFTSNEAKNCQAQFCQKDFTGSCPSDRYCFCFSHFRTRRREEIAETAYTPAPALERAEEQPHTPESKSHCRYTCTGESQGTVSHSKTQKSLYEPNKLTFTCKWS